MLISFCIPCMNRTYDLKKTMPYLIKAAKSNPPIEVVIVDYNSQDELADYIASVKQAEPDFRLTYRKFSGRNTYHMAHARNLSVMEASGEYVVIFSTDLYPHENFIPTVRQMLKSTGADWLYPGLVYMGVIVLKRSEFIAAGGYDERFELYGPEDKDLNERLTRRGVKNARYSYDLIGIFETSNEDRVKNYRFKMRKRHMSALMRRYYDENNKAKALVVNQGVEWGRWE